MKQNLIKTNNLRHTNSDFSSVRSSSVLARGTYDNH